MKIRDLPGFKCPCCTTFIGYPRALLVTNIGKFACKECGEYCKFNLGRELIAGLVWLVVMFSLFFVGGILSILSTPWSLGSVAIGYYIQLHFRKVVVA